MHILAIADLHLDMWSEAGRDPLSAIDPEDWSGVQAVIIAGDLTNKPRVRWKYAIRHLSKYIEPGRIYITPGNHDYYDFRIDGDDRLAAIAAAEGACFAQKAEIVIGHTRFLCCTLWTDFALHGDVRGSQAIARAKMNDYRYIRIAGAGFRKVRPHETAIIHLDHLNWLQDRLSQPHTGPSVVVTHHCPHPGLISAIPSDLDPVYGSNLTRLITQRQPDAWFFGHTHHPHEAMVGKTLVRNVSLGYPEQVPAGTEAQILRQGLIDFHNPERH